MPPDRQKAIFFPDSKTDAEGGEEMSLEAIKKVTETEQDILARKAEAAATAKKLVADADKAGRELVESARREAEEKVKGFMKDAEARAAEHNKAVLAQAAQACDALRASAETRLDEAAALIVRRVVNI